MHIQTRTHTPDTDSDTDINTETGKYLSKQDTLVNFAVMEAMRLSPAFGQFLPYFPYQRIILQLSNKIAALQHSPFLNVPRSPKRSGGIVFPQDALSL